MPVTSIKCTRGPKVACALHGPEGLVDVVSGLRAISLPLESLRVAQTASHVTFYPGPTVTCRKRDHTLHCEAP